jgi:hypothetical protein
VIVGSEVLMGIVVSVGETVGDTVFVEGINSWTGVDIIAIGLGVLSVFIEQAATKSRPTRISFLAKIRLENFKADNSIHQDNIARNLATSNYSTC